MAVTDEAIGKIKEMLISGELLPGDRLPPEKELSERLGLSRNSLREAVKALELIRVLDVRRGDDLHCTLEVPMTAAALGTTIALETLDGPRDVTFPPGTQPGDVVTLPDLGVGHLHVGGRGDLAVHVDVRVPLDLDDEQAELLRRLAVLRGEERPEAQVTAAHPSVFSRLKEKLSGRYARGIEAGYPGVVWPRPAGRSLDAGTRCAGCAAEAETTDDLRRISAGCRRRRSYRRGPGGGE